MSERIAKLLAMPDDDLNRVAALALGWHPDKDADGCAYGWFTPEGKYVSTLDHSWNPATDHNDAARMRQACHAAGEPPIRTFVEELASVTLMVKDSDPFVIVPRPLTFALLNATPRQITAAIIVALEQAKGGE